MTDWILLSLIATLALTVVTFNHWRRTLPATFQFLLIKGRIRSFQDGSDLHQEYLHTLNVYQKNLLSKKRYILSGVSIIVAWFLFFLVSSRYTPANVTGPKNDHLFTFIIWFFWIFYPGVVCGYFFGVAAWGIAITGFYIKSLTTRFQLVIQPSHPDGCGGLKRLGSLCFGMALPILIGATLLGLYSIGGMLYPDLIRGITVIPIAANISLIIFVLPLASVAFFLPLWNIHQDMLNKKEDYEDEYSGRIKKLEKRIGDALDRGALEDAKEARDELEIARVLHPDNVEYPIWPFDRRILLTFLSSQVIPLLSLGVGLVGQLPKH